MKKLLALVVALVMLAGMASALAVNEEAKGELTVWVRTEPTGAGSLNGIWGNEPGEAYYDYLKEQFPNVKINFVINRGWGEIAAAAAAGDAPDIFFWEGEPDQVIPQLLKQGLAEPLDGYIEKDGAFVNNFIPALYEMHKHGGKLYGLPFDGMPTGIFMNYDVLDKANVEYPSLAWTMDEFMAMCEKVTNKSDPYNTTIAIARNIDEEDYVRFLNMFFAAYGVTGYGEKDGKKYSNLSENPDAIAAMEAYMKVRANNYAYTLSAEERSAMGLDNTVWDIDWEAGIAATFPGVSSWAFLTDENGDPRFNQVFYPAFVGPKGSGATLNTISYSIYAGSKNKELAWEYLKAFTSKDFRENASAVNPVTGETVNVFKYDENTASFTFGLPCFEAEYTLNEEFAKLFDGLHAAMASPVTIYVDQENLIKACQKIAKGEAQLVDALKEYDDFVNANDRIVFPE